MVLQTPNYKEIAKLFIVHYSLLKMENIMVIFCYLILSLDFFRIRIRKIRNSSFFYLVMLLSVFSKMKLCIWKIEITC